MMKGQVGRLLFNSVGEWFGKGHAGCDLPNSSQLIMEECAGSNTGQVGGSGSDCGVQPRLRVINFETAADRGGYCLKVAFI
jgi:hypothetical protein